MKYLQELPEFQRYSPKETEAWRYLTHWFYLVIRELSTLRGFKYDATWIQERLRPKVLKSEIRKAIRFLSESKFFRVREDGSVETLIREVECTGGVYRVALGQFHQEMLSEISDSISSVPSEERLILGRTIALSQDNFSTAKEILSDAMEKIADLPAADDLSAEVYQIELAISPLTKNKSTQH